MFMPPVHELGDGGAPARSDQRTAVLYYERLKCANRDRLDVDGFKLLTDGTLYRPDVDVRVPAGNYCLEYAVSTTAASATAASVAAASATAASAAAVSAIAVPATAVPAIAAAAVADEPAALLEAYVCASDAYTPAAAENVFGSWKYVLIMVGTVPSIVCLVLTLVVYAMLSSLRNVHGYYVMCYVACLLVSYVCLLVLQWMSDIIHPVLCKLFGE